MTSSGPLEIRPLLFIRLLGGVVGGLVSVPYTLGGIYFLLNPSSLAENPAGLLMCVVFAVPGTWLTYRWMTVRGHADSDRIVLRGWLRTVSFPATDFSKIRVVSIPRVGDRPAKSRLMIVNTSGDEIGAIPVTLTFCRDFSSFSKSLPEIAEQARLFERHRTTNVADP